MQQKKLILAFLIGALTIPASQADENTPRQQRNKRAQMAEEAAAKKTSSERRAQKSSRDQGKGEQEKDSQTDNTAPSAGDAVKLRQDFVKDALTDLNIRPEIAGKIAAEANDPATAPEAQTRIEQITGAAADLDLVSVDPKVRNAVIDKISRSEKPKDTANEEVGKAAIDEVFGKNVTKLLPADKVPQARDVFVNLAKIQAALVTVGGDPNGKEVQDAVEEGAKLGVVNDDDARKVMEDGAHKILDKTFPPAKPGEKLADRLARMVKEQEKLQAELNAQKAAAAARAAAKARLAAAAKISKDKLGGSALTQGAAASTAIGRSVSAKLEVALGGGSGTTSGAGTGKFGTGIVRSQTSGAGGSQVRQDLASARLAAGDGGPSNKGKTATGDQPTTQPGNNTTQPAESTSSAAADQHTPQSPILSDSDVNTPATTQPATTQPGTTPAQATPQSDGNQPRSGTVSSPSSEFKVGTSGGDRYLVDAYHSDQTSERGATDTQIFSDGTFKQTETVSNGDGSYTTTVTTGTWVIDGNGNRVATSSTTSPATTTGNGQSTNSNAGQQNNNNGNNQSSNDKDGDGKDDDDDKDDDDKSDDDKKSEEPPPAEEAGADDTEAAKSEESKQSSSTPNPMDIGGGDPTQLAARSGGRIGNQEARRQQRGLDLARFGGAAGPGRDGKGGAPTLLTPEEKINAERALNMRLGGGVTNPNPLGKGNVVATDRDLKELHLRGNGGAKGPTDGSAPATPQDPHSPLGGVGPAPLPAGGTRINGAAAKGAAINSQIKLNGQVNTDAVKSTVK